ncbi:40S ribosomal protein S5-1 [Hordeum vulgare]|nr:40S ribosomal protein S5-1 [Hordeum vulgare]
MASPKVPKDKFFEKVINPYLAGVLQHPQSIEMHEGVLHIRDVEGPKKTGSVEARLEAMEQQVFKCQGMVEHGLNANHMMITEFTNKHKIDANDIGKHLSRLYDIIDHLQAQMYDLQNQNCHRSGLELINPVIEPGEVLPMSLASILCLLVNSVIIMWLALSPRSTIPWHLKTCCSIASSLVSMLPVFLGPSTSGCATSPHASR